MVMTSRRRPHVVATARAAAALAGVALAVVAVLAAAVLLAAVVLLATGCSAGPAASTSAGQTPPSTTASSGALAPSAKPTRTTKPSHAASTTPKPKAKSSTAKANGAAISISFVDVGQGDGIVIKAGSWAGLIDGGPAGSDGAVAAALSHLGIRHLDTVLATHPHADHIGDLPVIIGEYRPRLAYSDDKASSACYRSFMAALHAAHARIASVFRGQTLALGPLRAKILNPTRDGSDPNADSIVLLLDIRGKEVLLTGDDTGPSEDYVADVCARGPPLYLLKVAHHGSRYATYASFLAQTRPRFAVISVGRNSYGHPSPATVARLRAAHATVYTTQTNGTVTVTFLASGAVRWSFGGSGRPLKTVASHSSGGASSAAAASTAAGASVAGASASGGATIVYITATGHCYHRAGCRYLSKSKIPITLAKAKAEGYRACKVCDPPQ